MRTSILLCGALVFVSPSMVEASPPASSKAAPEVQWSIPLTPEPKPRHRASEAMMATGSVLLALGTSAQIVGLATWYSSIRYRQRNPDVRVPEPSSVPGTEIGIGLGFAILGTVFVNVGVKQHLRWKRQGFEWKRRFPGASGGIELRPIIGLAQVGVAGRF